MRELGAEKGVVGPGWEVVPYGVAAEDRKRSGDARDRADRRLGGFQRRGTMPRTTCPEPLSAAWSRR
jgi:hypothetical protein